MDSKNPEVTAGIAGVVVLGSFLGIAALCFYHPWVLAVLAAIGFVIVLIAVFAPIVVPPTARRWFWEWRQSRGCR